MALAVGCAASGARKPIRPAPAPADHQRRLHAAPARTHDTYAQKLRRTHATRPPYGNQDEDSLRATKSCGVKHVPLGNEEVFADRWDYREGDRDIHPGDIVLSRFQGRGDGKGTMPDMIRRFMKPVTAKGYAVARREDYL